MNQGRWIEVQRDIEASVQHFAGAARLFADPDLRAGGWEGYKTRMSLMHAMQAGHTSLEAALLRILDIHDEARPTGEFWHTDLIRRVARPVGDRPAVLTADLFQAADRTRRFRHVAVRTYDFFDPDEAQEAIAAAALLAKTLTATIAAFRTAVDQKGA
jgi:hypothetical protein